jgi:hypothetical protein
MCPLVSQRTPPQSSRSKSDHTLTRQKCISSPPSVLCWASRKSTRWVYPRVFQPLGYTNLVALLIIGLLIREVNVVFFLVHVSTVPKSARLSMILVGQRTLQEFVSVRKLLPIQLIPEIRCQTYKS